MMRNNSNPRRSFTSYEPKDYHGTAIINSFELVKQHILGLLIKCSDSLNQMVTYRLVNKNAPLVIEECNANIFTLFSFIRPLIVRHIEREEKDTSKLKNGDFKELKKKKIEDNKNNLAFCDKIYAHFIGGNKLDEKQVNVTFNFLSQFIYDVGITRIEQIERDPVRQFSESAYGEDLVIDDD